MMPAAIYLLAGLAGDASIGTVVAFTSMQNRLVSPVAQLLRRRRSAFSGSRAPAGPASSPSSTCRSTASPGTRPSSRRPACAETMALEGT